LVEIGPVVSEENIFETVYAKQSDGSYQVMTKTHLTLWVRRAKKLYNE